MVIWQVIVCDYSFNNLDHDSTIHGIQMHVTVGKQLKYMY